MSDEVTLASRYHVTQFSNHSFCFTSLVSNGIPYGRYFSSLGLLNNVGSIYKKYNIDGKHGPMGLVFGGDGGLLHNSYPDRYGFMPNSFSWQEIYLKTGKITKLHRKRGQFLVRLHVKIKNEPVFTRQGS